MASLPRDKWPEIFHTLNSVRRLAMHHGPLLGSQSHLHALVRDVLAQAENLRSQVGASSIIPRRQTFFVFVVCWRRGCWMYFVAGQVFIVSTLVYVAYHSTLYVAFSG